MAVLRIDSAFKFFSLLVLALRLNFGAIFKFQRTQGYLNDEQKLFMKLVFVTSMHVKMMRCSSTQH